MIIDRKSGSFFWKIVGTGGPVEPVPVHCTRSVRNNLPINLKLGQNPHLWLSLSLVRFALERLATQQQEQRFEAVSPEILSYSVIIVINFSLYRGYY